MDRPAGWARGRPDPSWGSQSAVRAAGGIDSLAGSPGESRQRKGKKADSFTGHVYYYECIFNLYTDTIQRNDLYKVQSSNTGDSQSCERFPTILVLQHGLDFPPGVPSGLEVQVQTFQYTGKGNKSILRSVSAKSMFHGFKLVGGMHSNSDYSPRNRHAPLMTRH